MFLCCLGFGFEYDSAPFPFGLHLPVHGFGNILGRFNSLKLNPRHARSPLVCVFLLSCEICLCLVKQSELKEYPRYCSWAAMRLQ